MPKLQLVKHQAKPLTSRHQSPSSLSNRDLIAYLNKNVGGPIKGMYARVHAEIAYIVEGRKRWGRKTQGRRVKVPGESTWTELVESWGTSLRTMQRWIAEAEGRGPAKHLRDKYDSADIRHLELIALAAQQLAEDNPDDPAFDPIRKAIKEKPSGMFIREGRQPIEENKWYEGNKNDGKHYWLTPKKRWQEIQQQIPGIVDVLPYPRKKGYDALQVPWHKRNYANIPFGTTIDPITGKKVGPTAWARKGIAEQKKGNSTLYPFPVDWFLFLLIKAGAKIIPYGPVQWEATEDGSSAPSGRNIVYLWLPGDDPVERALDVTGLARSSS